MPLNPPDIKELKAIIDWVNLSDDVRELSLKYGDVELFITRNHAASVSGASVTPPAVTRHEPAAIAAPPTPASVTPAVSPAQPSPPAAGADAGVGQGDIVVKAPMVGTVYAAPKPGAPAFVEVGARVEVGDVLCIVEVMKLMNNLEAPSAGVVTSILVENNQTVEYGQPLLVIRPDA